MTYVPRGLNAFASVGPSPKTDSCNEGHLREEHYRLPVYDEAPVVGDPWSAYSLWDKTRDEAAIGALLGQSYTCFEVLSHRKIGPTEMLDLDVLTRRRTCYLRQRDSISPVRNRCHLVKSVSSESGCYLERVILQLAFSDMWHRPGGSNLETECLRDDVVTLVFDGYSNLSLAHLVHRRPEMVIPNGTTCPWSLAFLAGWLSGNAWTLHPSMSVTRRRSPSLGKPVGGIDTLSSLMEVYRAGTPTAFDLAARDAQTVDYIHCCHKSKRKARFDSGTQNLVEEQTISELRRVTWAARISAVLDHFESEDVDALSGGYLVRGMSGLPIERHSSAKRLNVRFPAHILSLWRSYR